jgi:hypothetical protein
MTINIFDYLKALFSKTKLKTDVLEYWNLFILTRMLSQNQKTSKIVAKYSHYLFYLKPDKYYLLLYYLIPKQSPPYLKKVERKKEDVLLEDRIKEVLEWSDKEYRKNKDVVQSIIKDRSYWKGQLGLK